MLHANAIVEDLNI